MNYVVESYENYKEEDRLTTNNARKIEFITTTIMKELIVKDAIDEYLSVSKYINWNDDSIISKAEEFKQKCTDEMSLVEQETYAYYKWALETGEHIAYLVYDKNGR